MSLGTGQVLPNISQIISKPCTQVCFSERSHFLGEDGDRLAKIQKSKKQRVCDLEKKHPL